MDRASVSPAIASFSASGHLYSNKTQMMMKVQRHVRLTISFLESTEEGTVPN